MNQLEQLVLKKWNRTASQEELKRLEELLLPLSEEERNAYKKLEVYWKSSGNDVPEVNQVHLWNWLDKFIDDQPATVPEDYQENKIISFINIKALSIAASIGLLIFIGSFFTNHYFQQQATIPNEANLGIEMIEKHVDAGIKSTLKLPDGTLVTLNSKSTLYIPKSFTGNTREVILKGEAFFDVAPDLERPFIVKMDGANVEVLGTEFNVSKNLNGDKILLTVVEGKVNFSSSNEQSGIYVESNEAAILEKLTGNLYAVPFDEAAIAWKNGELVFRSASFEEIITELEKWYGVVITANKKIDLKNGFTGRYKNASLEEVLMGISFSVPFEFVIEGKNVRID